MRLLHTTGGGLEDIHQVGKKNAEAEDSLYSRQLQSYVLQTWQRAACGAPCLDDEDIEALVRRQMYEVRTTGRLASGLLGTSH
jgi:hypothetical protein